jgi:hypothetical protein
MPLLRQPGFIFPREQAVRALLRALLEKYS